MNIINCEVAASIMRQLNLEYDSSYFYWLERKCDLITDHCVFACLRCKDEATQYADFTDNGKWIPYQPSEGPKFISIMHNFRIYSFLSATERLWSNV